MLWKYVIVNYIIGLLSCECILLVNFMLRFHLLHDFLHKNTKSQKINFLFFIFLYAFISIVTNLWRCVLTSKSLASKIQGVSIQSYHYTMPISTSELHCCLILQKQKPVKMQQKMTFL